MKKQIYSPEDLDFRKPALKDKVRVFLAGPIQGAKDWRKDLPDLEDVVYLNPKRQSMDDFDWDKQVAWETLAFQCANIVLFWIPEESEPVAGRDYAQTTRMELLENLARNRDLVVGIDPSINARRYMVKKCKDYGIEVQKTFETTVKELKARVKARLARQIWFTSDTHFSSDRARTLSKRPFSTTKDMDMTMVERWNRVVGPNDLVYHLGDFGNYDMLNYLSGDIQLVYGNYERAELDSSKLNDQTFLRDLKARGFNAIYTGTTEVEIDGLPKTVIVAHEPTLCKNELFVREGRHYPLGLFGHIHGRQKIKPFGIDVGVDCNNFTPISEQDVKFYFNAIERGYYDQEVWVQ